MGEEEAVMDAARRHSFPEVETRFMVVTFHLYPERTRQCKKLCRVRKSNVFRDASSVNPDTQ
jgi:hypothetical protein